VLLVSLAAITLASQEVVDLHPYSVEVCAEELNQPEIQTASQLLLDVGSIAAESDSDEMKSIVDRFVQEGVSLDESRYGALGYKWDKMQAKAKRLLSSRVPAARRNHALFRRSKHHGLSGIEYKYMRLYQKYHRLHQAYKRGCMHSRFWLRLNKWHWRVLMASDKKLRKLVNRYASLRRKDVRMKKAVKSEFAWTGKAGYKSAKFFKNVIALSRSAIKASHKRVARLRTKNQRLKWAARRLAKKMAALKKGIVKEETEDLEWEDWE